MDNLMDVAEESVSEMRSAPVKEPENSSDYATEESVAADATSDVDYESLINEDIATLKNEFPELRNLSDITELENPIRYAALRDLGLSPKEAYMATTHRITPDTRAHIRSIKCKNASASAGMMSQTELATARDLFPDMSDSELQRLYKRVTK